jgi:hypothetical protein
LVVVELMVAPAKPANGEWQRVVVVVSLGCDFAADFAGLASDSAGSERTIDFSPSVPFWALRPETLFLTATGLANPAIVVGVFLRFAAARTFQIG